MLQNGQVILGPKTPSETPAIEVTNARSSNNESSYPQAVKTVTIKFID
jgi:hypothetical protein